jgi:hypothetical protein
MTLDIASIVAPAGKALAPATGSTLSDAWQAIIGDRVAAWRISNAAKLQAKVHAVIEESGLKAVPTKIPERYAFTWFEEATKQDEPEIQELFATLLARAAAGNEDASDRRHIETLSRFTPMDALLFDFIFDVTERIRWIGSGRTPSIEIREYDLFSRAKNKFGSGAWMSVEHLTVLGVLERQTAVERWALQRLFEQLSVDERSGFSVPMYADLELEVMLSVTESGFSLRRALGKLPEPEEVEPEPPGQVTLW